MMLDVVHMFKLVKEAIEHYKFFVNNRKFKGTVFKFTRVTGQRTIMKVKVAAQLFSHSIAIVLQFCKMELKLLTFEDVYSTALMLLLKNDLCDILNTKVHSYDFKRELNKENAAIVFEKLEHCQEFLLTVSTKNIQ